MPTQQAITEFKILFKSHYGINLTDQEAYEKASGLLRLYKAIQPEPNMKMKPDHGKKIQITTHTQ